MNTRYPRKKTTFLLVITILSLFLSPASYAGETGDGSLSPEDPVYHSQEEGITGDREPSPVSVCSLSSDFSKPHVFLTKKKITLNGMRRSVSADTFLVMNVDGDYEVQGAGSPDGISITPEKTVCNGLPAFRLTVSSTSAAYGGTYKYNLSVRDQKTGTESDTAKLTLVIKKKNPSVKWKKSLVTLNYADKEDAAFNTPSVPGVSIAPIAGNSKYKSVIPECVNVTLVNENTARITAGTGMELNKRYYVTLWLLYTDSIRFKAVKKKFAVIRTDKAGGITFKKAKGSSLDLSDRRGTSLHYVPLVKNSGLMVRDIHFKSGTVSESHILEKVFNEDTGELTDIYVKAVSSASLSKGKTVYSFDTEFVRPGKENSTVNKSSSFKAAKITSKLKLAFISGNQLKLNEVLSDNKIAGTLEVRVAKPAFSAIDPESVKDITCNSGKVERGTFEAKWTIDPFGQAARIRVVANKDKLVSGKKYNIVFTVRAKDAAAATPSSKLTLKYKAP